jgi:hypothetical protein
MVGYYGEKGLLIRTGRTGPSRPRVNPQSERGATRPPLRLASLWGEDDVLSKHSVQEVHAWYGRLARLIGQKTVNGHPPLASLFLSHYIKSGNSAKSFQDRELVFAAPPHLREDSRVVETLKYHRKVYLTEEKARIDGSQKWAGALLRWKNPKSYNWDRKSPLGMEYHCLVEMPIWLQLTGTDAEKDLLYALRGFQLQSKVRVEIKPRPKSDLLDVTFSSFVAWVFDTYDFDFGEFITVPNPDYRSNRPDAVAPESSKVRVYHKNAKRMEKAGLAAPYPLRSEAWTVTDPTIAGPGTVDSRKQI